MNEPIPSASPPSTPPPNKDSWVGILAIIASSLAFLSVLGLFGLLFSSSLRNWGYIFIAQILIGAGIGFSIASLTQTNDRRIYGALGLYIIGLTIIGCCILGWLAFGGIFWILDLF